MQKQDNPVREVPPQTGYAVSATVDASEHDIRAWPGQPRADIATLAAFCLPNDDAVSKLLYAAGALLRRNSHDDALLGYAHADLRRVRLQAAAAWNVLRALKLQALPLADDYLHAALPVRAPGCIVETRHATSLDASLLLAAMFERMGLHPLVVLRRDQALVGVWTHNAGFAEADGTTLAMPVLQAHLRARDILLMESALLCQRAPFRQAQQNAHKALLDAQDHTLPVVDIARARAQGVSPLPARPAASAAGQHPDLRKQPRGPAPEAATLDALKACLGGPADQVPPHDILRRLSEGWATSNGDPGNTGWHTHAGQLRQLRDTLEHLVSTLPDDAPQAPAPLATEVPPRPAPSVQAQPAPLAQNGHTVEHVPPRVFHSEWLAVGEDFDLEARQAAPGDIHPLALLQPQLLDTTDAAWQRALLKQARTLATHAQVLHGDATALAERLGLALPVTAATLPGLLTLTDVLANRTDQDATTAFLPNFAEILDALDEAERLIARFATEAERLSCPYPRDRLLRADLGTANRIWSKARGAWWLRRRIHAAQCSTYLSREACAQGKPDPSNDLPILFGLHALHAELAALAPLLRHLPGWREIDSDLPRMRATADLAARLRDTLAELPPPAQAAVRAHLLDDGGAGSIAVDQDATSALDAALRQLQHHCAPFQDSLRDFAQLAGSTPADLLTQTGTLIALADAAMRLADAHAPFAAWCAWRQQHQAGQPPIHAAATAVDSRRAEIAPT